MRSKRFMAYGPVALLILAVIPAALSSIHTAGSPGMGCPLPNSAAPYPNYVGDSANAASNCIEVSGSSSVQIEVPSNQNPGRVVAQWPTPTALFHESQYTMYLQVSEGPLKSRRAILPLAKGPPVTTECSQPVKILTGSPDNLECSTGGVNTQAWDTLVVLYSPVMMLGRGATATQVESVFCSSQTNPEIAVTNTEMESLFQISSAYYGWTFTPIKPTQLTTQLCASLK